jgi:cob(I)alamin adenosyltransferase
MTFEITGEVQIHTAPVRFYPASQIAHCMRAAAQGVRVLVVQLLKGGVDCGPDHPRHLVGGLVWLRPAVGVHVDAGNAAAPAIAPAIRDLWQHVAGVLGQYDLVLVDEAGVAVALGLLDEAELVALVEGRPLHLSLILTGAQMPQALGPHADLWSEMRTQSASGSTITSISAA